MVIRLQFSQMQILNFNLFNLLMNMLFVYFFIYWFPVLELINTYIIKCTYQRRRYVDDVIPTELPSEAMMMIRLQFSQM